jgi:hypothetical protein
MSQDDPNSLKMKNEDEEKTEEAKPDGQIMQNEEEEKRAE